MTQAPDVLVLGAGVIGCSAAALLAEAGLGALVVDREGVAAGASGRNSGVLQHPLHSPLSRFHAETLAMHREVLDLPDEPDGILLLGATSTTGLPADIASEVVPDARVCEPLLREAFPAVWVRTGWVVGPRAVTVAWADRARAAGVRFAVGDGRDVTAGQTLLATGAWTAGVRPLWGVTQPVAGRARLLLQDAAAGEAVGGAGGEAFTLCGDVLGSSASHGPPDPAAVVERLLRLAEPWVGRLSPVGRPRVCPRPSTHDGLPLVGRLDDQTWVCAGHGAWGISTGPATARIVADAILGRADPPPELDPTRAMP